MVFSPFNGSSARKCPSRETLHRISSPVSMALKLHIHFFRPLSSKLTSRTTSCTAIPVEMRWQTPMRTNGQTKRLLT